MGLSIKKTRAPYSSAAINASIARGQFDPRALGIRLTPPSRAGFTPVREKTGSELAVEAENKGLGGNYKAPVDDLLRAIRGGK